MNAAGSLLWALDVPPGPSSCFVLSSQFSDLSSNAEVRGSDHGTLGRAEFCKLPMGLYDYMNAGTFGPSPLVLHILFDNKLLRGSWVDDPAGFRGG
jgi:hypothetical protein